MICLDLRLFGLSRKFVIMNLFLKFRKMLDIPLCNGIHRSSIVILSHFVHILTGIILELYPLVYL
jgi:hypothetical protein